MISFRGKEMISFVKEMVLNKYPIALKNETKGKKERKELKEERRRGRFYEE